MNKENTQEGREISRLKKTILYIREGLYLLHQLAYDRLSMEDDSKPHFRSKHELDGKSKERLIMILEDLLDQLYASDKRNNISSAYDLLKHYRQEEIIIPKRMEEHLELRVKGVRISENWITDREYLSDPFLEIS